MEIVAYYVNEGLENIGAVKAASGEEKGSNFAVSVTLAQVRVFTAFRRTDVLILLTLTSVPQVVLVFFLFATHLGLSEPTIRSLDRKLKSARGTILQFPEDIVNNVQAMRKIISEYARQKTK